MKRPIIDDFDRAIMRKAIHFNEFMLKRLKHLKEWRQLERDFIKLIGIRKILSWLDK